MKPALRFENSNGGSQVFGSVVHGSDYYGLYIKSSSEIQIEETTIVKATSMGVVTLSTTNVLMDKWPFRQIEYVIDTVKPRLKVNKEKDAFLLYRLP